MESETQLGATSPSKKEGASDREKEKKFGPSPPFCRMRFRIEILRGFRFFPVCGSQEQFFFFPSFYYSYFICTTVKVTVVPLAVHLNSWNKVGVNCFLELSADWLSCIRLMPKKCYLSPFYLVIYQHRFSFSFVAFIKYILREECL